MKTLMKLANSLNKSCAIKGYIIFDGTCARATDIDSHAIIENGPWNFETATVVDSIQIKTALALTKKPVWSGDTLNGVKLVSCYPAKDFPDLPIYSELTRITCDTLPAVIGQTLPASADSDIRYYLNSLCLDHDSGSIIGCDGHRLHIVSSAYAANGLKGQSLIPRYAFDLIGAKNVIHIDVGYKYFRMGYVGGYLIGRLVDGKFPDYSRVLPADSAWPNRVTFNGAQVEACKTIVAVGKVHKSKFLTCVIDANGTLNACDVSVPCFDEFKVNRPCNSDGVPQGQDFYGINGEYLRDALQCAGSGVIGIDGPNDSILVINGAFRAVVMPCQV